MLVTQHPYLMVSLFLLAACLGGAWMVPSQRRPILLSGLLCTPYAFSSPLFVPEYWRPKRIVELVAGPEDLVFSFAAGGLVWMLGTFAVARPPTLVVRLPVLLRRYCLGSGLFFGLLLGLRSLCGIRTMPAVLLAGLLIGTPLLVFRRDLWRMAIWGAVGYGLAYPAVLAVSFRIWPELAGYWNWRNLNGLALLAVPVEEFAYAAVFGAVWTLAMAHAFGARRLAAS